MYVKYSEGDHKEDDRMGWVCVRMFGRILVGKLKDSSLKMGG
jgi:hypothetical protein